MDKLLLEIQKIQSRMGILVETTIPPSIWSKLTKYFDEVAGVGKKELDNLSEKGLIDPNELKWLNQNADLIKSKASKITNPANLTDPTLKKFDQIFSRLSSEELVALTNKAVSNFINNNPKDFIGSKTLLNRFNSAVESIEKGVIDSSNKALVEYVKNGGKIVDLYRNEISKMYDGEVLEELVRRFKNDERFMDAERIILDADLTLEEILDKEIQKLYDDPTYKDLTDLQKTKKLNELRDSFINRTKAKQANREASEKMSEVEIENLVTDKIKNEIKNVSKINSKMLDEFESNIGRFLGGWKDLSTRIYDGLKKDEEILKKEIDSLLYDASQKMDFGPQYAQKIRNKMATLSGVKDMTDGTLKAYWTETEKLLRSAFPDNADTLIGYIKSNGVTVEDWFSFLYNEMKTGTKTEVPGWLQRNWELMSGAFKTKKDLFEKGFQKWNELNFTWITRLINLLLTGHTRTLNELIDRFIKKTYVLNLGPLRMGGKKGYKWGNVLATWIEFWVTAKIIVPLVTSVIYGIAVGIKMLIWQGGDENTAKNLIDAVYRTFKEGFLENFDVFLKSNSEIKGILKDEPDGYDIILYRIGETFDLLVPIEPFVFTVYEMAEKGFQTPAQEAYINKLKDNAQKKVNEFKEENSETIDKITNIKENPRGTALLYSDGDAQDKIGATYPDGERNAYYAIKYDNELSEEDKLFLIGYAGGGDKTEDVWIMNPDTNKKIKLIPNNDKKNLFYYWEDKNGNKRRLKSLVQILKKTNETLTVNKNNNMIMENKPREKFGEDNFKHWKDTFLFKSVDEKNPGQYKEVKINMEDVMDRINHYRKKYDEDDAFVRAVIDTHEDVVKIMFTKDLAHIHENATPRGLALVLRVIKEERGELEIFSVARPANGNWFLVKGDYTPNQLANMDLEKKEPKDKEEKKEVSGSEELKKKEQTAIDLLKRNEKEGLNDLPTKVRKKLREKMGKGWTTEPMPSFLNKIATKSEINTIFNDKIEIYKLESNDETFDAITDNSSQIFIKRGFCRSLYVASDNTKLNEKQEKVIDHILDKCDKKYLGKLGVRNF